MRTELRIINIIITRVNHSLNNEACVSLYQDSNTGLIINWFTLTTLIDSHKMMPAQLYSMKNSISGEV